MLTWCKKLIFALLFFSTSAQASTLSFSRNARTYETVQSSLMIKAMAHACLGLIEIQDDIPCNAALTGLNQKSAMGLKILTSNGYSTLQKTTQLLSGQIDTQLTNDLFSTSRVLQAEADANLFFQSRLLAIKYTPTAIRYYSSTRNQANPDVEVFGIRDESWVLQSGYSGWDPIHLGFRVRYTYRQYVKNRFQLLSLPGSPSLLAVQSQKLTFFEPSVSFFLKDNLNTRFSLQAENIGTAEGPQNVISYPQNLQAGVTISPKSSWGDFDISLDYRTLTYEENDSEKLRLGAIYRFGILHVLGGMDYDGISGGIFYSLHQMNAGIIYSTNQVPWRNRDFYFQTVYVQAGWQL